MNLRRILENWSGGEKIEKIKFWFLDGRVGGREKENRGVR